MSLCGSGVAAGWDQCLCVAASVPRVARRVRVPAWGDGVRVADAAVATVDADFAATSVVHDLLRSAFRLGLGSVMGAGSTGAWGLEIPATRGFGTT